MKLPAVQARELMKAGSYGIDKYYLEKIPKGIEPDLSKTICIISEWLNEPTYYANQTFKGWTIGVEVQEFYKLHNQINSINNEIAIARQFVKDGWTVEQSKNHIQDPDTGQVIKVFYFAKDLVIKKERDK